MRAGYDWQYGQWLFFVAGEVAKAEIGDAVSGFSITPASYTFERELEYTLAGRLRGGYAFDQFLVYATGGLVRAEVNRRFSTSNTANSFTPWEDDSAKGYQLGAGVEMKLSPNWCVGLEYLQTSLEDEESQVDVGPGTAGPTNPFLLVNPAGTFIRCSSDKFAYNTISATTAWRF